MILEVRIMHRIRNEINIIGINLFLTAAAFTSSLIVLSVISGELLDFYAVSFEVLFPFFTTIAVGEWGKTRADGNFDIIAAQSKSLFGWVLLRYAVSFCISGIFAVSGMIISSAFRYELPLWELLLIYFPLAFFLSSLCALFGIYCTHEHVSTLICGIIWLIVLLTHSLLRIPGIAYFYLFIRYADGRNPVWLWNKGIVTITAFFLWGIIYLKCKKM